MPSEMKTNVIMIPVVLMALLLSCSTKENSDKLQPLQLSTTSVEFEGLGGEQKTLLVTSSTDWYARSSDSWLRLHIASGEGGADATPLRLSVEDNDKTESRSGVVTVNNLGGESLTFTVTQSGGTGGSKRRGISTVEDLLGFVNAVNGDGSVAPYLVDGVVKFNADIDAGSITEWVPIGTDANPLIYNIDGNNKVIKNINWTIDVSKYPAAGFIGAAEGIRIRRLTLGEKGTGKITFEGEGASPVSIGGIVGIARKVELEKVVNNAALEVKGTSQKGADLSVGGLIGQTDKACHMGGDLRPTKGCINYGDIVVPVAAQVGGLAGHNVGIIENCTYDASITAPKEGSFGPGWICSHSDAGMSKVHDNVGKGFVAGVPSLMRNSMMNCTEGYDPEGNTVDWTQDAYYDWTEVESMNLHSGVKYSHYSCTWVPRHIHVLEVDLKNPGVEIASAYAGDMIPNPNGNANSNNGFKLRERLSDVCARKRAAGEKILAGVNASFFDSNVGITRGFHVQDGQPLYINNPAVVQNLVNHVWSFTVFNDATASCGIKEFTGTMRMGGKEYPFYSVNDTTLRHTSADYQANLYTSHYVRNPYPSRPAIVNELAKNALYIICEYTSGSMTVNTGYASAKVVEIKDGRNTPLGTGPYFTQKNRVGIALSGEMAKAWSSVRVGDKVEFACRIAVDGVDKPIVTLVTAMFQLMTDGQDASNTPPPSSNLYTKYDPKTFPVVSQDLSKVWLVEVDGRALWYSLGVKGYEMNRIAKKLGGWWVSGLDGGGSSAMWVWNAAKGKGSLVNRTTDALGERSDMNYLLVREK